MGGTAEAVEFGAAMRDVRAAHNADLATVATSLRIRQVYLQAIEDGRFDDLPGPTYASGFVRAYAEYLGLDIDEVMRRYREITRGGGGQTPLVAPSPVSEGRMPTGFILLIAAVLAAGAYGSWYYLTLQERDAGEIVASLPQRIADAVGLGSRADRTDPVPPAAAPTPASEPRATPAAARAATPPVERRAAPAAPAPEQAEPAAPPPKPVAPQAPAAVAPQPPAPAPVAETPVTRTAPGMPVVSTAVETTPLPTPEIAARAEAERTEPEPQPESVTAMAPAVPEAPPPAAATAEASRIVLRATGISWVELRDAEGRRVFSRLLKRGETYNVPSQRGITLATGNAGALDILVDGQAISPIGPIGEVRRDILLEPDALLGGRTVQ